MKLLRLGEIGKEKPALVDKDGNFRDLSLTIKDLNPETLNFETIDKINKIEISSLPKLDQNLRIGPCISKPSKFIGIGLNFKDHAEEQNLPIPKEPIIFSKFTSCITGPNDPIVVPKGSNHTDGSTTDVDPFIWEAYYSFRPNDSIEVTPAVFGGSDVSEDEEDDLFGAAITTTFKF